MFTSNFTDLNKKIVSKDLYAIPRIVPQYMEIAFNNYGLCTFW